MAKEKGLTALSLTDHDSVLGLPLANQLSQDYQILFLPGIEFTAMEEGIKFHVLGYNIDYTSKELIDYSHHILAKLNAISKKQIQKLQAQGIGLPEDQFFLQSHGGPLYRGKLLKALSDHGLIQEAEIMNLLPKYFDPKGLCYVEDQVDYPDFSSVVDLIKNNGGFVVLAHPAKLKKKKESLYWQIVNSHKLDGVELYHPSMTDEILKDLKPIIEKRQLLVTGGSDYHGLFQKKQSQIGDQAIPDRVLEDLFPFLRNKL